MVIKSRTILFVHIELVCGFCCCGGSEDTNVFLTWTLRRPKHRFRCGSHCLSLPTREQMMDVRVSSYTINPMTKCLVNPSRCMNPKGWKYKNKNVLFAHIPSTCQVFGHSVMQESKERYTQWLHDMIKV